MKGNYRVVTGKPRYREHCSGCLNLTALLCCILIQLPNEIWQAMHPFHLGEGDKQHHTGKRHRVSGLIRRRASPIWVCSVWHGEMLPSMLSSCKQQGGQVCFFQKASFSKALIFFPVLKKSDLATCLQLPIAWWQSLPRPSRTRQCHNTTMDSATAPEHHKLLGPCSRTLVTPLSLGLASNWAAAQTHTDLSLKIPDPEARATLHLKSMSFLILMDVRKIYPERSYFTASVFWRICSFSALGSQATAPSPNPLSPMLEGYKLWQPAMHSATVLSIICAWH